MLRNSGPQNVVIGRRGLLSAAAIGAGATALLAGCSEDKGSGTDPAAPKGAKDRYRMVFIQIQPHTVPKAWADGIKDVADVQKNIQFELLDGQNKAETQISLMNTAISQKVDAIFLQPADSVGLGASIKKAREAGIPVYTLNIDANEAHAGHVEMNHYFGAKDIAARMGEMMGGKGTVAILNAPPGIVIRDQRTNGFVDGLKEKYPDIKVVADQNAEWDRKKAQDVLTTILAANPNLTGVYGVNDSMALGAVDVAKQKGARLVIFGNDGEKDALESIEAGGLTGTQYTDVRQQGRFAASAAIVMATAGVSAKAAGSNKGHLLMPYTIATRDNVGSIKPEQRW